VVFILDIYLEKKRMKAVKSNLGDYVVIKYIEWLKDKDK
jgi:hypothetical protein